MDGPVARAVLLFDVILRVLEDYWSKLHVAWFVDTVYVAECGSHSETMAYFLEGLVSLADFLGLGVEAGTVDVGVVYSVFLPAGNAELDLDGHAEGSHTLEVFLASAQIFVDLLLGKIKHVGTVEGFTFLLVKFLTSVEQTIDPRQKLTGGVIGVEDDGNVIGLCHGVNVLGPRYGAGDGRLLAIVREALARIEYTPAVGKLDHHGRFHLGSRFKHGVDRVGAHHVDRRKRIFVF